MMFDIKRLSDNGLQAIINVITNRIFGFAGAGFR